jgi:hypothetical protein
MSTGCVALQDLQHCRLLAEGVDYHFSCTVCESESCAFCFVSLCYNTFADWACCGPGTPAAAAAAHAIVGTNPATTNADSLACSRCGC